MSRDQLKIQYFAPSCCFEAAPPELSGISIAPRRRRRLRLYLVGLEEDTQQMVDFLHVHGCIDRIGWSRVLSLPENGLYIQPDSGDVLRYLQRDRQRTR